MITSPDTLRANRIPPGQHLVERWPVLHHGSVPDIDKEKWKFKISGLIDEEIVLTLKEFMEPPQVEVFSDIHCVTTWSRLNNTWKGVSTNEIKGLASILPEAKYVMVHGAHGFSTNLSLQAFFSKDVLFATKHDGNDLSAEHGAPVRLVVPRLYFWKSAKWVTGVEFMAVDKPGFWESGGYHMHGDPWKEERYSSPR
jgi:DMSO/TMAO reductase YedYZ molybdopterin-dependent catalytic subunit